MSHLDLHLYDNPINRNLPSLQFSLFDLPSALLSLPNPLVQFTPSHAGIPSLLRPMDLWDHSSKLRVIKDPHLGKQLHELDKSPLVIIDQVPLLFNVVNGTKAVFCLINLLSVKDKDALKIMVLKHNYVFVNKGFLTQIRVGQVFDSLMIMGLE